MSCQVRVFQFPIGSTLWSWAGLVEHGVERTGVWFTLVASLGLGLGLGGDLAPRLETSMPMSSTWMIHVKKCTKLKLT